MNIYVDHLTEYRYERPVGFGEHSLFLRPRESHTLSVAEFNLETTPPSRLRWVRDCFNNVVAVVSFGSEKSAYLSFRCRMAFDVAEENPFDFILEERATRFPFTYNERETSALRPYLEVYGSDRERILGWVTDLVGDPTTPRETISFLTDLNRAIQRDIAYKRRDEEGVQTADETLDIRQGSCRDMAELLVETSRQLGLAARFVSGYLYEPPPAEGQSAFNRAAGSMHAWAEVYLPGAGWRGFDPTNAILADHYFLTSAVANKPDWVSPIQGKFLDAAGVGSRMTVRLEIEGTSL